MSLSPQPVYHRIAERNSQEDSASEVEDTSVAVATDQTSDGRLPPLAASTNGVSFVDEDTEEEARRIHQRRLAVVLLSSCTILLFADQNLMSPNLTAIADYFGFDDEERDRKLGGDIALAFFVLGAPASFVIGFFADLVDRTQLFAATVFAGEGACMATYWTTTYRQLYICRAITGISVGGALPLIYSLLSDMYPADERHAASAAVSIGMGTGISVGQGIAGFLGPTFGWRLPFLVISIPALLVAAAVVVLIEDPERGGMEQATLDHRRRQQQQRQRRQHAVCGAGCVEMTPLEADDINSTDRSLVRSATSDDDHDEIVQPITSRTLDCRVHWKTFLSLLSTPTVILSLMQGAPGCVPWGIVNVYLNDFLAVDRGMTVEYATVVVLLFGVGVFGGMLVGGQGGSYLYRIDKRYPALLAGSTAIFGCFPFWFLLNRVDSSSSTLVMGSAALLSGLSSGVTGPIIKATLQNVTFPHARGVAFALFNTFDDFGRGLGPVFVALMISRLGGRTPAFNVGVFGWVLCGLVNLCVFFSVERDESKVQMLIAESLPTLTASAEDGEGRDSQKNGADAIGEIS